MKNQQTQKIALVGILSAFVVILFLVQKFLVPSLPQGGSIQLHYLGLILLGLITARMYSKWEAFGITLSVAFVVAIIFQMLGQFEGIAWVESNVDKFKVMALDYYLPYMAASVVVFMPRNIYGSIVGILVASFIMFLSHYTSGVILWGAYAPEGRTAVLHSIIYNGSYMALTCLLTLATVPTIVERVQKSFVNVKVIR